MGKTSGILFLTFCLINSFTSLAAACGVERWAVKTGTDPDIGQINMNLVTPVTVVDMRSWPAPGTLPANNRVAPHETAIYTVRATLSRKGGEADKDYHLVLVDAAGNTFIGEVPDPQCVGAGSPFLASITKARAAIDAQTKLNGTATNLNIPVQITGVGFFDFIHGQIGVAPNGIEMHPVLDIQFNPAP